MAEGQEGTESRESDETVERQELLERFDSAGNRESSERFDATGSLGFNERVDPAGSLEFNERFDLAGGLEFEERFDPAEKGRPAKRKRSAGREESTQSQEPIHSEDWRQLDKPTHSEDWRQPDELPHLENWRQLDESTHPEDSLQPDELPESYSYEATQPYDESPHEPAQLLETGQPDEIEEMNPLQYLKGRGAQFNPKNRFLKSEIVKEHIEGIDDWIEANPGTEFLEENAKGLVNKVDSPDVGMWYSMNPYQGCEHGCTYCYARNVHEYWGYSAGLDFEQKIIVKKNAPELLRKFLMNPKWECVPLSLSGNTDCYQPAEKKFGITRQLLEVCLEFNQPVGIITKNAGILRDKDLLAKMAKKKLVSVLISITSFDEELRRTMEPRTTTARQRIRTIKELSEAGVRMGVMLGPMIPGLNEHELQRIMKAAAENGATFSAYTFIRLNGAVKLIFHDWLYKNFPDRADKVWHLIESGHGGKVNDTRFGVRMRGEGNIAQLVAQQYTRYTQKYGLNVERWELDTTKFMRPGGQMKLF